MDIVFGAVNQASRNAEITRVAIGKSMPPIYPPSPFLMAPFVTALEVHDDVSSDRKHGSLEKSV